MAILPVSALSLSDSLHLNSSFYPSIISFSALDAMILAAGLGTRLRPITDTIPKALIPVGGVPMLERVARRLIAAGATQLVVNVHHHAGQIEAFLRERHGFGVHVSISDESDGVLETGGGLLHAAPFFRRDAPFFLHTADVLSDCDLRAVYRFHQEQQGGALATLVVNNRPATRYFLFDDDGLCGHGNDATGVVRHAREPIGQLRAMSFCGIHVIAPRIFELITERGKFSIVDLYLRLAADGHRLLPYDSSGCLWIDIGKPEQLQRAEAMVAAATPAAGSSEENS